jgi:hypothetical protein
MPLIGSRFLALFTTAPTSNAGTGGTEVSGGAYARVQIAGALSATTTITSGSTTTITMPTNPGWVVPGMNVFDLTNAPANGQIGTVLTYSGTLLTLVAAAAHSGTGATDSLQFSAWPASTASVGTEPATTPASVTNTGAVISFLQATANWGTVTSWGLYDTLASATNLITWDYLGNFKWIPFTCTSASPGVLTTDLAADAPVNGTPCVVTAKLGATLPTTAGSWAGVLTSAGLSTNTFNLGVNTTSTGGGQFRQITQQIIPQNVTASFASSTFTLTLA